MRFKTDSKIIAIRCRLRKMSHSSGMPLSADAGFDLYDGLRFVTNYRPEVGDDFINMEAATHSKGIREYTLYFPLYSGVDMLEIGI